MAQAKRHKQNRRVWLLVGGILASIVIILGIFLYLSNMTNGPSTSDPTVFNTITHVDSALLAQVGTGNAQNSMHLVKNGPALHGPTGKPEFFYVGGEYCPYCAAQRWAVVVALSRFGSFGPLVQITSSEENIDTLSFHHSTYTSQYLDFVGMEIKDNQGNGLDTLSAQQRQIFTTYDAPPYVDPSSTDTIPFIDINNQYVSSGSYYLPDWLVGLSWQDIAQQIKQPNTNVSKGILGSANYLTAAICVSTHNQPSNVCQVNYIQQIGKSLANPSTD